MNWNLKNKKGGLVCLLSVSPSSSLFYFFFLIGSEYQHALNFLQGLTNIPVQKGNIFFPQCLKQVCTVQGFTPNKNLLNKTGCFTSWMQSANPSLRTWFLVVESEVCRKKRWDLTRIGNCSKSSFWNQGQRGGRKKLQKYVKTISEKFQLVAMCGTHKLNMWLYYICWFTHSARELRSETWQENNAYLNMGSLWHFKATYLPN